MEPRKRERERDRKKERESVGEISQKFRQIDEMRQTGQTGQDDGKTEEIDTANRR
jgi:hypothetical protein